MRLTSKIILSLFISLAVFQSIFVLNYVYEEEQFFGRLLHEKGEILIQAVAQYCVENLLSEDYPVIDTYLEQIASEREEVLEIIIEKDGVIVSHYKKKLKNLSSITEPKPEDTISISHDVDFWVDTNQPPVKLGVAKMVLSNHKNAQSILHHTIELVAFQVGAFILTLGLIHLVLKKIILHKIELISHHARKIGEGGLREQLKIKGSDELTDLAEDLNDMMTKIFTHQEKIKKQNLQMKHQEKELIAARHNAEDASKAKSEFLANMSHEIRTPMNAVLGFAELLDSTITDKTQKSYLRTIRSSGRHLISLINDILDLSKVVAGKLDIHLEPIDLSALLSDIKEMFTPKALEINIDLNISLPDDLPRRMMLDETRLLQVLINLVGNSIKFTSKGFINTSAFIAYSTELHNRLDLIIKVEDSGIGISKDKIGTVFDTFTQGNSHHTREFEGVGLGLAITKKLIQHMNGEISVRSEPGKGSSFTIVLHDVEMLTSDPDKHTRSGNLSLLKRSFKKARVLVVDDNKVNLNFMTKLFQSVGLEIYTAENGQQAVLMATEQPPDLIVMDIRMPVMDGIEAARQIRRIDSPLSKVPIIALTADVRFKEERLHTLGFDGIFLKPVSARDLFKELSKHLETKENPNLIVDTTEANNFTEAVLNQSSISDELAGILRDKLGSQLKSLKGAFEIDAVDKLAENLQDIARIEENAVLSNYAESLKELSANFLTREIDKKLAELRDSISLN